MADSKVVQISAICLSFPKKSNLPTNLCRKVFHVEQILVAFGDQRLFHVEHFMEFLESQSST